jgi:hypothetical protein
MTHQSWAEAARDDARGEGVERGVVLAADFGDNHEAMIANGGRR